MEGTILSHYRILEKLGEGGMGVVYKAYDTHLDRLVALKLLHPYILHDPVARERFKREARTASALDHPGICTIHDIAEAEPDEGDSRPSLFIAMAFYEGRTLKEKIAEGVRFEEAIDLAVQMAEALAQAHKAGIVHRDIKPANVMVTNEGRVKILDFGLAKSTGSVDLTKSGTTVGTVAYMSPEQVRGEEVDAQTDVWSFGVVLYEMLSGRNPFLGDYEQAIYYAILNEDPKPFAELGRSIPEALQEVVRRSLAKRPDERFATASELLDALLLCRAGLQQPTSEREKRRRLLARASVLIAVIAVAAAAILLLRMRAESRKMVWAAQQSAEVERLLADGQLTAAYDLAERILAVNPDEPVAVSNLARLSWRISIRSDPPGARVYLRRIDDSISDWHYVGGTPTDRVRIPYWEVAGYEVRLEKEGYRTVDLWSVILFPFADLADPAQGVVKLDRNEDLPEEMIRIPGTRIGTVEVQDFFLDRYEVTNRAFQQFVDAGGYTNPAYWTEPFEHEGNVLTWQEAMARFKDASGLPGPATWLSGSYPEDQGDHPVGGISWYEAAAYARFVGKDLPTVWHWDAATPFCRTDSRALVASKSNFSGSRSRPVGQGGARSEFGTYDLAGNVREWVFNTSEGGRITLGGAWNDPDWIILFPLPKAPFDRDPTHGVRLARYAQNDPTLEKAREAVIPETRTFRSGQPATPAEFALFRRLYDYDPRPLNARIERRDTAQYWIREKVTFDAPYGGERGGAYLFLPRHVKGRVQAVLYWPGSFVIDRTSVDQENPNSFAFVIKSGRAVVLPLAKGWYERDDATFSITYNSIYGQDLGSRHRDLTIQWVQDFRRTIDYLETRDDVDADKLAFRGYSFGGEVAPIILSVEPRFKVAFLFGAGLEAQRALPEADAYNFLPYVSVPVLILNGRHDVVFPLELSQKPFFRLLGTAPEHKQLKLYERGHAIPLSNLVRDELEWFDRYLGPVETGVNPRD